MPVQPSAIDGRYVAQWDKDGVDDAGVLKIDLLALGALSQLQQAVRLVRGRTGIEPDLSRIDYRDAGVFDDLGRGDTVGVFQVESAAQMQTIVRMRPRDIYDLALEVAAVRPGVGANDGVAEFLRRREGMPWNYHHPLERSALERSLGVIMFQDQVVQLGMDVGGFSPAVADRMRRAFGRRNGAALVESYRRQFLTGAVRRGVPEAAAEAIFGKFNPHYMFPEGHAVAFAFTAYQMAWLRRYHPLEFYVALFNEQPMGFWDLDTLKQDARRLRLRVARPDVNLSELRCTAEGDDTLRLGLTFVKGVDRRLGETLLQAREAGPFGRPAGPVGIIARGLGKSGPGRRHGWAGRFHRPPKRFVAGGRRLRRRSAARPAVIAPGGVGCACGIEPAGAVRADAGRVRHAGPLPKWPRDGTGAAPTGPGGADQRRFAGLCRWRRGAGGRPGGATAKAPGRRGVSDPGGRNRPDPPGSVARPVGAAQGRPETFSGGGGG